MASTIRATQRLQLSVVETFDAADMPGVSARAIAADAFNRKLSLNADSTPAATAAWAAALTGTQTINLAALARTIGGTLDATGKKLLALLLTNLSTTATLTLAKGASNGYAFNGAAEDLVLPPSASALLYFDTGLAAIASGSRTLDVTVTPAGSGAEVEDFQVQMVFGT